MIIITGSKSFIGKSLVAYLKKKKEKIFKIDINEKNSTVSKKVNFRSKNISKFIKKNSTLIHLAAVSNDRDGKKNPELAFSVNVNGTLNLLESCRKKRIKHFIFASTEWVYDKSKNNKNSENDEIDITSMTSEYAISKIVCEQMIKNYSKFFKITILRFGIIYANRRGIGSAIESIVDKIKNKEKLKIGSLNTSRNFIHIDDIISGIYASVKSKKSDIYNLAGNQNISLGKIIKISSKILNVNAKIQELNKNKSSIRIVENKKAIKYLNWKPKINIHEGIKKIVFNSN
jgi:nucleoside-diphosphate-sugar epimerase|tara:strand:+ start:1491 stop:2354 length:864 start_codon:yes stop_codon:yes gene_type:complete